MAREVLYRELCPGLSVIPRTGAVHVQAEELAGVCGVPPGVENWPALASAAERAVEWSLKVALPPEVDIVPAVQLYLFGGPHPRWRPGPQDVYLARGGPRYETGYQAPLVSIPQRVSRWKFHGLEWGYLGSGPHALALEVLSLWFPPSPRFNDWMTAREDQLANEVWGHAQAFKQCFVGTLPVAGGVLLAADVQAWLDSGGVLRVAE